ncbi:hypothetical protein FD754_019830 [Muntiacus muntjak]|uniref:Tetratricopeptide repeat protein 7 N-terminal domain-containing protein n=1 Tax=Muntiacus muntjak TaxID=9888 RepID=A0A5N3V192_MUNMU|nr:hypothetical protein FD754_019830 [Muntiacus muntjak]
MAMCEILVVTKLFSHHLYFHSELSHHPTKTSMPVTRPPPSALPPVCGLFVTGSPSDYRAKSPQSCLTLCDPTDRGPASGLPFPLPGDLPSPGIEPVSLKSPVLAGRFFTTRLKLALDTSSFNSLVSVNTGCPGSSRGEVSIYNAGDLSLLSGSGQADYLKDRDFYLRIPLWQIHPQCEVPLLEKGLTKNFRSKTCLTIARQLAEILLRGMCEQSYWSPLEDPPCQSPLDDPLRKGANTKTYTLTRKARVYSGENIFCPQENTEEALLLLLISESMANRDAVLSRIPEHKSDRLISLQSASVVYDLLTIALGRRGQYEMLSESARAVKVLKECIRLRPDDATIPLLAAKLCMGSLHWLEEAEKFAKTVVDAGEKTSEFKAKGYLALGLTYSLQATDASLRGMQEVLQRKALLAFQRLLFSKVKLESLSRGPDEALLTCKHMLQIWKSCYNLTNPSDRMGCDPRYSDTPGGGTCVRLGLVSVWGLRGVRGWLVRCPFASDAVFSNPHPAGSIHATSVAASRVEQALSEVASSLQSSAPKQGPLHPWMTLAQIWLHAAEVYVGIGKPAEATACTQEAANLFPMSHNVLYMRGQVAELRGNVDEARRWYEEALSISPTHVKSMQRLVELLGVGSARPAWVPGPCEGRVWVRGLGPAGQATLWPRA